MARPARRGSDRRARRYDRPSVDYPVERLTHDATALSGVPVTNLDRPVFALVNLPETLKGALFARYSRYQGTLRRLLLDEFAADLPDHVDTVAGAADTSRAAELYERIFLGYGDDSVAQLGGAHVACEWVSNVLTKVLQRPRLGAYLEQSTRYIAYDAPMPGGGYRFYRDGELGPAYTRAMDELFAAYSAALPQVVAWAEGEFPRAENEAPAAHARALKAKALDLLRGLLPASSLSHMGIFATGQTYEQLILHLLAHPLPEAREYGRMILQELQTVVPSFLTRSERPERGGEWIGYLEARARAGERWARRLGLDGAEEHAGPSVTLLRAEGDEDDLLAALLFEASSRSEERTREMVASLDAALRADLTVARGNRPPRPGRGLETLRYRFEIVADYGAFRDLQRHRMLTIQWQPLSPHLGAEVPEQARAAGLGELFERAFERSRSAWQRIEEAGLHPQAPYALCLAFRIRYVLDMNAREAMHLIELRSGREGHPTYRAVAQAMHEQIAAVHPGVAAAMKFVDDSTEPRLERMMSEIRTQRKRAALDAQNAG